MGAVESWPVPAACLHIAYLAVVLSTKLQEVANDFPIAIREAEF